MPAFLYAQRSFQTQEVAPRITQVSLHVWNKHTVGLWVIYTPRLKNKILSLILWHIFIAIMHQTSFHGQIQPVWSLIIKIRMFIRRRAGLKVTLKYSEHLLLPNEYFIIEDFVSPTWYIILHYSYKAIYKSRLNWFSFTVIWFVFLSVFFFIYHLQRPFLAPQMQTTTYTFVKIWNTLFCRICFHSDRNRSKFCFLAPWISTFSCLLWKEH